MARLLDPRSPTYWESFTVAHGPLRGHSLKSIAASVVGILQLYRLAFGTQHFWVKNFERRAIKRFFGIPKWEQALRAALDARQYNPQTP